MWCFFVVYGLRWLAVLLFQIWKFLENKSIFFISISLFLTIFLSLLGDGLQSWFLLDICNITLVSHPAFQKIPIVIFKKNIQEKHLKNVFFWITHREMPMDKKSKDKSCAKQCPGANFKVSWKSKIGEQSYCHDFIASLRLICQCYPLYTHYTTSCWIH